VARFRCEGCAHEHLVPFSCNAIQLAAASVFLHEGVEGSD